MKQNNRVLRCVVLLVVSYVEAVLHPDLYVFGLPRSGSGSFYNQAKKVRKTLISSVLRLLYDFLSSKNGVNVASKSNTQNNLEKNNVSCYLDGH